MARKTREELQELMKQEGVSRIWSWSKVHCFMNSKFEYMLKYIQHVPEDRQDCIYATTGGLCHDVIEKFYTGQIKYEDMINEFNDGWAMAYDIAQLKFDRNDEEHDKKIGKKYYDNLNHFFNNHSILTYKPMIEQFVKIKIGDNLFQGYIDCCFKDDDGNYHIVDWKSSSIYKGKKADDECGQLVLYSIALNQMGIPFENIRIAWNFLKYCTIQYEQANGAVKERDVERYKIGESLQSNARMWLKKFGYEEDEVDKYLMNLIDANSIHVLPKEVQEKYIIKDCYVYVPLTSDIIRKWETTVINTINDILLREKDYEETQSENCFWDSEDDVKSQSYYFSTLSGYSPSLNKPYGKYLDKLNMQRTGGSIFCEVGSALDDDNATSSSVSVSVFDDNDDLSWLYNL